MTCRSLKKKFKSNPSVPCQFIKINPNIKIPLLYWSPLKYGYTLAVDEAEKKIR